MRQEEPKILRTVPDTCRLPETITPRVTPRERRVQLCHPMPQKRKTLLQVQPADRVSGPWQICEMHTRTWFSRLRRFLQHPSSEHLAWSQLTRASPS